MRLLFVVDGQSPHSRNWIKRVVALGHEAHLVTTYPCEYESLGVRSCEIMEVDLSARMRAGEKEAAMGTRAAPKTQSFLARLRGGPLWRSLAAVRNKSAPYVAVLRAGKLRRHIRSVQPDLVHAMRIPFEGIFAARACEGLPVRLLLSSWGNDFTLFAAESTVVRNMTRRALRRADGLHSDCFQDLRLAEEYGFNPAKPTIVLPGNGGVRTNIFHRGPRNEAVAKSLGIPQGSRVVINPRGMKPYIRNDEFFAAIPEVLGTYPGTIFLCCSMEGNQAAEQALVKHKIVKSVRLLPSVSHEEMAELFRIAEITVSASDHDGSPNTLLEAMACGSVPVAGNIEPIREWIVDGENGILVDQRNPGSIAKGIAHALADEALRETAAKRNWEIVMERAAAETVFVKAVAFYKQLAEAEA